ncbi:MAG: hypothetical protein HOW73_10325 [Polyangiaceae bacterium]|nr:hypothetical protein [Polyangiaceae bacterium]
MRGGPTWDRYSEAPLVAVGIHPPWVITADEDGRLVRWDLHSGVRVETTSLCLPPRGLSVDTEGHIAVLVPGSVIVLREGTQPARIAVRDPVQAAFSRCGKRLAVVAADGSCSLIDLETRAVVAPLEVRGQIIGVAAGPRDAWLLTTAGGVHRVAAFGGRAELVRAAPATGPIACSAIDDTVAFATAAGVTVMRVEAHHQRSTAWVGALEVTGIAFGQPGHLAVKRTIKGIVLRDLAEDREYRINL